jgi:hypothetical protein
MKRPDPSPDHAPEPVREAEPGGRPPFGPAVGAAQFPSEHFSSAESPGQTARARSLANLGSGRQHVDASLRKRAEREAAAERDRNEKISGMVEELSPFLPRGRKNALGTLLLRNLVTMQIDQEARRVEERGKRLSAPEREASRKVVDGIQRAITDLMTEVEERTRPEDRPIPASVLSWLESMAPPESGTGDSLGQDVCRTCRGKLSQPPVCAWAHGRIVVVDAAPEVEPGKKSAVSLRGDASPKVTAFLDSVSIDPKENDL